MRTALKYSILLVLVIASGFYIVHGPVSLEDIAPFVPRSVSLEDITPFVHRSLSVGDIAPDAVRGEAPVAQVEPPSSASIDEQLDYLAAKRLGSLAGWRAFLAAHASGAYAQFARAEVERRLPAGNAAAEPAVVPVAVEEDIAPVPVKREAPVAHAALAPSASLDEELDYLVAKRLGSLAGWRAFLAAHASGAYAQSARAEVERLLPTGKAPAPAALEVSNGASTDASVAGKATGAILPPRGTEIASGYATPAPAAAEVLNDSSPDAKAVSQAVGAVPLSQGTEVAALTPDEVCKRDEDRLARLGSSPSSDEAQRFANELGCEKLRPQVLGLMASLARAAPGPVAADVANGASLPAPANSSAADGVLTGVCASQRAALDRLRKEPSTEATRLFWRDLQCERLRPQVRLLLESLNLTPESLGSAVTPRAAEGHKGVTPDAPAPNGADPVACRRESAELNRIRAAPDLGDAKRFASIVTCDVLKPQAARLLESLTE
jgi:hypothetical protein